MPPSALSELAKLMRAKHDEGDPPYVLFVGTAASQSSGCSAFCDIVRDIAGSDDPADLFDLLDRCTHGDRAALLGKHLRGCSPSSGYRHLAELVKAGYFDVILTTNVDSLLETALVDAGLRPGRAYVCIVNGRDRDEEITRLIKQRRPRVKILKLHGDLELGILPITPAETFQFPSQVNDVLREYLNRDVLIVSYGPWDSNDVNHCLELSRHSMWYVALDRPDPGSFINHALVARNATRNIIFGEEGQFDRFFEALHTGPLSVSSYAPTFPPEDTGTPPQPQPELPTPSELKREHLTRLRQVLTTRFDEGELRTLCFDLGIDYHDLPGEGKANKARELVAYLGRHGRISELVRIGKQRRPGVSWH